MCRGYNCTGVGTYVCKWCTCVCVHEPMEESSSIAPHLLYWSRLSQWTWCSPVHLDKAAMPARLGSEPQPSHYTAPTEPAPQPRPSMSFFFFLNGGKKELNCFRTMNSREAERWVASSCTPMLSKMSPILCCSGTRNWNLEDWRITMDSFALTAGIFMKIKDSSKLLISRYERNIDYQNTGFPGIQTRSLALLWSIRRKILTEFLIGFTNPNSTSWRKHWLL